MLKIEMKWEAIIYHSDLNTVFVAKQNSSEPKCAKKEMKNFEGSLE